MKKYFLVLLLFFMSIILIFSCRKSFEPQPNPDQKISPANNTEMKIQSFLNEMNNDLKSGSTYTIEQAIWYAEATLNYSYAIYDSSFIYLSRETSSFSINLNPNNTVNQSDLLAAYAKMVDSLEAHYDGIPELTKHVVLCDVINVSSSAGTLNLSMISVIGCGYTLNQYGSFGQSDWWWSGDLDGKCNGYSGIGDATTALEYELLHPYIAPAQNVRIYYTDIDTVFDIDPSNYYYGNAPRDYRGYFFESTEPDASMQCLGPDELNFYISNNGIPYIIEDNNTFIDKEFCDIDLIWDFIHTEQFYLEEHFMNISYGVRNETQMGTIDL
jgi:hypothetical protein